MRRTPYTAIGISRKRCARCGDKAHAQWNVCALGKQFFAICKACDVALNRLAVEFMGVPNAQEALAAYEHKMETTNG